MLNYLDRDLLNTIIQQLTICLYIAISMANNNDVGDGYPNRNDDEEEWWRFHMIRMSTSINERLDITNCGLWFDREMDKIEQEYDKELSFMRNIGANPVHILETLFLLQNIKFRELHQMRCMMGGGIDDDEGLLMNHAFFSTLQGIRIKTIKLWGNNGPPWRSTNFHNNTPSFRLKWDDNHNKEEGGGRVMSELQVMQACDVQSWYHENTTKMMLNERLLPILPRDNNTYELSGGGVFFKGITFRYQCILCGDLFTTYPYHHMKRMCIVQQVRQPKNIRFTYSNVAPYILCNVDNALHEMNNYIHNTCEIMDLTPNRILPISQDYSLMRPIIRLGNLHRYQCWFCKTLIDSNVLEHFLQHMRQCIRTKDAHPKLLKELLYLTQFVMEYTDHGLNRRLGINFVKMLIGASMSYGKDLYTPDWMHSMDLDLDGIHSRAHSRLFISDLNLGSILNQWDINVNGKICGIANY